jgi:hypothetical protein
MNQQNSTHKKTRLTTPARKEAFLASFAQHGIVSRACRDADIDRSTVYLWKEHDAAFLVRYNQALEEAKDAIREEVRRRAQDGWDEDVYQLGKYAGTVHKYSDTLLIFHAKMLMPEYRDKQQVELTGPNGGPLQSVEVYKVRIPDNGRDTKE